MCLSVERRYKAGEERCLPERSLIRLVLHWWSGRAGSSALRPRTRCWAKGGGCTVDDGRLWQAIAEREGLVERDLNRLSSPWHTDADLGRPIEVVTDMSKSRKLGFAEYQPTDDAFFDLFSMLQQTRIIP